MLNGLSMLGAQLHTTITHTFIKKQVIPGNEVKVSQMLNGLSMLGAQVVQGRSENLHTSGHAYQVCVLCVCVCHQGLHSACRHVFVLANCVLRGLARECSFL